MYNMEQIPVAFLLSFSALHIIQMKRKTEKYPDRIAHIPIFCVKILKFFSKTFKWLLFNDIQKYIEYKLCRSKKNKQLIQPISKK